MTKHHPVLLHEVIEYLDLKPGVNVVDATVGGGGHAEAMLERVGPHGRLLGIDADPEALVRTRERLRRFGERVVLVQGNFRNLKIIVKESFPYPVHGILLDLGLSSDQLADTKRGFSFLTDAPLDMRFGAKGDASTISARELVNQASEAELARIIRKYGEERHAQAIAHSIAVSRKVTPIETTRELASRILSAVSHARRPALSIIRTAQDQQWSRDHIRLNSGTIHRKCGVHPATRTFQALRIAVNQELGALEAALPQAAELLEPRGRLAVISFHSLEDRMVKRMFSTLARETWHLCTKKPLRARRSEAERNPRARSAKLRVAEKI